MRPVTFVVFGVFVQSVVCPIGKSIQTDPFTDSVSLSSKVLSKFITLTLNQLIMCVCSLVYIFRELVLDVCFKASVLVYISRAALGNCNGSRSALVGSL